MLIAVVIALLQAGAEPAPQAAPVADPPAVSAEAQTAAPAEEQEAQAEEQRPRRCRARNVTGTRLQSLVVCRTREGTQDQDTRDTLHNLQRSGGTNGG